VHDDAPAGGSAQAKAAAAIEEIAIVAAQNLRIT
jgi:hypothetical protein